MKTRKVCLCAKCDSVLAMHNDGVILKGAVFSTSLAPSGEPEQKAVLGLDFAPQEEPTTQAYCQMCFLKAVGWEGLLRLGLSGGEGDEDGGI